jgi:hypothetical protein
LIAAHKTGRRAYLCEIDPVYCDRIIARWERFARDDAEQILCGIDAERSVPKGSGTSQVSRPTRDPRWALAPWPDGQDDE